MKICMLTPFPSADEYENERLGNSYSFNLIEALARKGDKAINLTILANKNHTNDQEFKNIKIKRLWSLGKINPFSLFKKTIEINPDIVHIQYVLGAKFGKGLYVLNPFIFMLLVRMTRIKFLISIHNIVPSNKLYNIFNKMLKNNPIISILYTLGYRFTTMFIGKIASKIIVLDEGTKKWSIEQYGYSSNKMLLIPHGMFKEARKNHLKKDILGINENWNVLLFFGKIHPRKGVEFAIKAMPPLLKEQPNTVLVIAGGYSRTRKKESKSYDSILKKLSSDLGLENNIIFKTKFLGEEIPILFRTADVVLLPYFMPYGASGVMKLAATYKKAIITTFSDSRKNEIKNGVSGILLNSYNEEFFAKKINFLLQNKSLLKKMGEIFYKNNIVSSNWEKVASDNIQCYNTLK